MLFSAEELKEMQAEVSAKRKTKRQIKQNTEAQQMDLLINCFSNNPKIRVALRNFLATRQDKGMTAEFFREMLDEAHEQYQNRDQELLSQIEMAAARGWRKIVYSAQDSSHQVDNISSVPRKKAKPENILDAAY